MCDPATIGSALLASAAIKKLTPKLPDLPKQPDPGPKAIDPKVQGARKRERDKARAAHGRQSTMLTGSGGLTQPASTTPKTLLGS